mgnify:CR=1 FL=1
MWMCSCVSGERSGQWCVERGLRGGHDGASWRYLHACSSARCRRQAHTFRTLRLSCPFRGTHVDYVKVQGVRFEVCAWVGKSEHVWSVLQAVCRKPWPTLWWIVSHSLLSRITRSWNLVLTLPLSCDSDAFCLFHAPVVCGGSGRGASGSCMNVVRPCALARHFLNPSAERRNVLTDNLVINRPLQPPERCAATALAQLAVYIRPPAPTTSSRAFVAFFRPSGCLISTCTTPSIIWPGK